MNEWRDLLNAVLIVLVVLWCLAALPLGRDTMRADLLKEGFRVVDANAPSYTRETNLSTGDGRWIIEIWRDGWVRVER